MISKEKQDELIELAKPIVKWLQDNTDPHHHAIIDCNSLEMTSSVFGTPIELVTEGPTSYSALSCREANEWKRIREGYEGGWFRIKKYIRKA